MNISRRRFGANGAGDDFFHRLSSHHRDMNTRPADKGFHTERGFAIISAIVILVVLAALGAFIVTISTTQHLGSSLDVQGVRAYQAARTGLEWGVYHVTRMGEICVDAPAVKTFPGMSFPGTATSLSGFAVTVSCSRYVDANGGPVVFEIEAIACNLPAAGPNCPGTSNALGYVERRLRVSL